MRSMTRNAGCRRRSTYLSCAGPFVVAAALFFSFAVLCVGMPQADPSADWRSKVDGAVLEKAERALSGFEPGGVRDDDGFEFLVFLSEQADLSEAATLGTKLEKGTYVFQALTEAADETQPVVAELLEEEGAEYRRFWAANMIWVRGDSRLLELVARRPDVGRVYNNAKLRIEKPVVQGSQPEGAHGVPAAPRRWSPAQPKRAEWNIELVNAPRVWAEGVTGEGAVVAGTDTGYDWTHPAIKNQYRGWDGSSADHNHNWHDAVHSGGRICEPDSPEPCDEDMHGTHTMGIMVGDDGINNLIGMAPGAEWIGCRCWEPHRGTDIAYVTECLQWMIAPTDLNDLNPDPSKAPHAVNNSWICVPSEGCADPNALKSIIENVRAAGIVVLGGAGNDGPDCSSSMYPPAIYEKYFSVGATTVDENIAGFSSRGPITADGSGRVKPDISAPGQDVRSCIPGGEYMYWSGTSFAGPHVAGLVALLISANPDLAGDVDLIEDIIEQTAVFLRTTQECGGVPGTETPNNTYGYGRIDAYAAYELAVSFIPEEPEHYEFALKPNYPNPFGPVTNITYSLSSRSDVLLTVYDAAGRLVKELVNAQGQGPDEYTVPWDGKDESGDLVPSGVYFCRIRTGEGAKSQRMIFVR